MKAGKPGKISFSDPDAVVAIDTIDGRAGLALWTREDLLRYHLLRPDYPRSRHCALCEDKAKRPPELIEISAPSLWPCRSSVSRINSISELRGRTSWNRLIR